MRQTPEQHRLRHELHELLGRDRRVLDFLEEGSLDGLWYWDLERPEEEWMSPRFWLLMGRDPAMMPHEAAAWQDLIHPEDLELALANFEAHCADPDHAYDQIVRYRHTRGHWVTVRCRGMAIRDADGRPIRMLGAHTDVTILKDAEEALRRRNADLEAARDEAQLAARAKATFLEVMSHEVRTPLNGVIGMADALSLTDLDPGQARMVGVLRASSRNLSALLEEIIEHSRGEAVLADLERSVHDPRASAERVVGLFTEAARAQGAALSWSCDAAVPERLVGAERAMRQVMTNLVSNAVKHVGSGEVTLSLRLERDAEGDLLVAEVSGVGGVARDPDQGDGSGFGLAIVSELCARLGGDALLGGSDRVWAVRFRVERPEIAAVEDPAPSTQPAAAEPLRLLVAEDTEMNRLVISAMLERAEVEVVFAHDGREALERLDEGGFDGAFIDVRMPVIDGVACARLWREREAARGLPPLPLIACSADAMSDQIARHLAAGFDRHLSKPLHLGVVDEAVAWLSARRRGKLAA